ncbi:MAG TPA: NAD(P)H-dependent oxidoreductase [Candidatus Paceibacterota bacterium]|jgi:NAD(P)H-dependent FMN reductase|nr:NAD(P)H-dependent oxidoreductase [Candidatus Paceibacterota bacterium]
MDKLKVKVILGSTRQSRFSEKPGNWIFGIAKQRPDIEVELLDLREYPMPFFDEPVSPSAKKEPYKNEVVAKWTAKIKEADAFVIIAPEYNHGYPAVLKNALDYVYQEWNNKAVGFVSYGSVLGARSVEQLREIAVELQMAPIRNAIHMPYDVVMALNGGKTPEEAFASYVERAKGLLDQLVWWGNALKVARNKA